MALLLLALIDAQLNQDNCSVIEHNTKLSENGEVCFTKWIFWETVRDTDYLWREVDDLHVKDWRFDKPKCRFSIRRQGRKWVVIWQEKRMFCRVEAITFIRTITYHDAEVIDRSRLRESERSGLLFQK